MNTYDYVDSIVVASGGGGGAYYPTTQVSDPCHLYETYQ